MGEELYLKTMRWAQFLKYITNFNRFSLLILSIIIWDKVGFFYAISAYFGVRAAQYLINYISVTAFVNSVMKREIGNPFTAQLKISAVMVISELIVLFVSIYYALQLMFRNV